MPERSRESASGLANVGARLVHEAHLKYRTQFDAITKRACDRFSAREWSGLRADADRRLDLYSQEVQLAIDRLLPILGQRRTDRIVWASLKAVYSQLHIGRPDRDVAETFFNSVTRRVFSNVGVDPDIEFVHGDADVPASPSESIVASYDGELATQIKRMIADTPFAALVDDLDRDARLVAARLRKRLGSVEPSIDVIRSPFFREQGAYLVGRVQTPEQTVPLVICLRNRDEGVRVDAGDERRSAGRTHTGGREDIREAGPLRGEPVEVRIHRQAISKCPHARAEVLCHEQQDVRPLVRRAPDRRRLLAAGESEEDPECQRCALHHSPPSPRSFTRAIKPAIRRGESARSQRTPR